MDILFEKAQKIVEEYNALFAKKGIVCALHKRHLESAVLTRGQDHHADAFDSILYKWDEQKEKKCYHGQNNRYYMLVLDVAPTMKRILQKHTYQQYAFIVKKVERAHIGKAPKETFYNTDSVLYKLETRLARISKRISRQSNPVTCCQDRFYDVLRYVFSKKYPGKKNILGRKKSFWEILFMWIILGLGVLILLLSAVLSETFK